MRTIAMPLMGLLLLAGCGPKGQHTHGAAQSPATLQPAESPQPDLSPVAEPPGIIFLARVRSPRDTLTAMEQVGGIPMSLEGLLQDVLRTEGLDVIEFGAPIDLVVTLDPASTDDEPKFLGAFSMPLNNLEQARIALERQHEILPLLPGVYRAKVLDRAENSDEEVEETPWEDLDKGKKRLEESYCDLAPALGNASARLVCSRHTEELDALRPWMTRGLPLVPIADADADIHGEFRLTPLRDRYLPTLRTQAVGAGMLARQWLESDANVREPRLLQLPDQLLQEGIHLFEDLDRFSFAGKLNAKTSEIRFQAKVEFRSRQAWLTRLYTHANDKAALPPEFFWRLPRDADSATYSRSADPELYRGAHETLRLLVADSMTQIPISTASKSAIESVLARMPLHGGMVVSAKGSHPFRGLMRQTDWSKATGKDAIRQFENTIHAAMGWSVVGVEAPSSAYVQWLRTWVTAYDRLIAEARNHPDFGKAVRDVKWMPTARVRTTIPGYPQGSFGVEFTSRFDSKDIWDSTVGNKVDAPPHPAGPGAKGQITLQCIVVPDGANRTWIGISTDEKALKEKLNTVLGRGAPNTTIANMPGLEPLRTTPTVAGGFFTAANLLTHLSETLQRHDQVDAAVMEKALETLPNRLQSPMLMLHTAKGGPQPSNEMEIRIQRGLIEDVAGLFQFALSPEGRDLIEHLKETADP